MNGKFSCFLLVPTVLCSGRCNSINIYPILTYFMSFESKSPAPQDSSFSKSRANHRFSSLRHCHRGVPCARYVYTENPMPLKPIATSSTKKVAYLASSVISKSSSRNFLFAGTVMVNCSRDLIVRKLSASIAPLSSYEEEMILCR